MKKELETLKPRVLKIMLVTIILMLGLVLWANAQKAYVGILENRDCTVEIWVGALNKIHKGDTISITLKDGESYYWQGQYDTVVSKRVPKGATLTDEALKGLQEHGLDYITIDGKKYKPMKKWGKWIDEDVDLIVSTCTPYAQISEKQVEVRKL